MPARPRPIAIDLFAGAGGLSLGFEQAGFDLAAAVELDPIHCAAHEFNFPETPILCADVSRLSGAELRQRAGLGSEPIDVVCGGAPCQGFSMIGKRALDDPRNRLAGDFLRLVTELEATYFVFENVKGLTVGKHRKFLDELIEEAQRRGYDIVLPYRVLNAADYGVPQDRRRLFLLGVRRGAALPKYPSPTSQRNRHDLLVPPTPTVWEALSDIPNCHEFPELAKFDMVRTALGVPNAYTAPLRGIERDPKDLSYPRAFDAGLLTASKRAEHTDESQRRFAETAGGETEPISRFHKLDPDGVSNTLRAGTASDRGAFTSPRPIHPFHPRCITVREAARLHSYPDWFRFHVTKWHGFRQIGNSVPPLLGRAVAAEVFAALERKPCRPARRLSLGSPSLLAMNMGEAAAHYGVSRDTIPQRTRMERPALSRKA